MVVIKLLPYVQYTGVQSVVEDTKTTGGRGLGKGERQVFIQRVGALCVIPHSV